MVELLLDTLLLASLQSYDILHGFQSGRGKGTSIMELKLAQKISSVDHNPLFLISLDPSKVYDTLDRDRLIQTLEGYGMGPHLCGLLENFLDHQKVVPR